jgi:hypothetical protein
MNFLKFLFVNNLSEEEIRLRTCVSCKHYKNDGGMNICLRNGAYITVYSNITGEKQIRSMNFCETERAEYLSRKFRKAHCGENGQFWEAKK